MVRRSTSNFVVQTRDSEMGVANEVLELRHQISVLRDLISSQTQPAPATRVRIFIQRYPSERKPYLFVFHYSGEKRIRMSPVRAALTLTLLLDLEQRCGGCANVGSVRDAAARLLSLISSIPENSERLGEQIRVALYRYAKFWKEELQEILPARFDAASESLLLNAVSSISLEIISSDAGIEDALPMFGQTPMLQRLRRDRFLFVPGGGRGAERFLEEIYSTPGHLDVVSTYARLQLITVPPGLLERYGSVPEAISRHAKMHRRLAEGRLKFTEIISEEGFEDLLRLGPRSHFSYFPEMQLSELIEHLEFVHHLISARCGYRLILTRSDIPFFIGRYNAQNFSVSSFFKIPSGGPASAYSSFAVWGPELGQMAETTLFDWLMNHPSTTSDQGKVLSFLESAINKLSELKNRSLNSANWKRS